MPTIEAASFKKSDSYQWRSKGGGGGGGGGRRSAPDNLTRTVPYSINLSKTCTLIIPPKLTINSVLSTTTSHNVMRNHTPLNIVTNAKYLGVYIDNKLCFKEQIRVLEGKVARSVGILCKLKQVLPRKTLLQLYHALIHPLLAYGIIIWGATYSSYLTKLKTLQNKALRVISGAHYRDNAIPLYKNLDVLQLDDL